MHFGIGIEVLRLVQYVVFYALNEDFVFSFIKNHEFPSKSDFFYSISLWVLKNPEFNADFGSEGASFHTGKKLAANKPFFSGDL